MANKYWVIQVIHLFKTKVGLQECSLLKSVKIFEMQSIVFLKKKNYKLMDCNWNIFQTDCFKTALL